MAQVFCKVAHHQALQNDRGAAIGGDFWKIIHGLVPNRRVAKSAIIIFDYIANGFFLLFRETVGVTASDVVGNKIVFV